MKLTHIDTCGVAGVRDVHWSLRRRSDGAPAELAIVTGRPGSGKTRLLEAIIAAKEDVGAYGAPPRSEDMTAEDAVAAKVKLGLVLTERERLFAGLDDTDVETESIFADNAEAIEAPHDPGLSALLARYDHTSHLGKWDWFPSTRWLSGGASFATSEVDQARLRMSSSPRKYDALVQLVIDDVLEDEERTSRFEEAFATLCTSTRFVGARRRASRRELWFHGAHGDAPLAKLSASEQQAFLFAASFVALSLEHSVILIDTPELWLAPHDVVDFVGALTHLGRGNQLIVATTHDALVASASASAVLELSSPEENK